MVCFPNNGSPMVSDFNVYCMNCNEFPNHPILLNNNCFCNYCEEYWKKQGKYIQPCEFDVDKMLQTINSRLIEDWEKFWGMDNKG